MSQRIRENGRGTLILMRHGRTDWNDRGVITGWADPPLNVAGEHEARRAGRLLRANGLSVDVSLTSMARRAIETASIVLEELGDQGAVRQEEWRLNERHFGVLEGLDRPTALELFGRPAARDWKHDPHAAPPPLSRSDPRHPSNDVRYAALDPGRLPATETSVQLRARVEECWLEEIVPHLERGTNVLILSHCHSLRALTAVLAGTSTPPSIPPFRSPGAWHLYRRGVTSRAAIECEATGLGDVSVSAG